MEFSAAEESTQMRVLNPEQLDCRALLKFTAT